MHASSLTGGGESPFVPPTQQQQTQKKQDDVPDSWDDVPDSWDSDICDNVPEDCDDDPTEPEDVLISSLANEASILTLSMEIQKTKKPWLWPNMNQTFSLMFDFHPRNPSLDSDVKLFQLQQRLAFAKMLNDRLFHHAEACGWVKNRYTKRAKPTALCRRTEIEEIEIFAVIGELLH